MEITWGVSLLIILAVMFTFLFLGVPIGVSLGLSGFLGLLFMGSSTLAFNTLKSVFYTIPTNFVFLAVPLFILMSQILFYAKVGDRVYSVMEKLFASFRGGLALATIGAGTIFAAICGSSVASCAALGPITIGEMLHRGVDKRLAVGSMAAAGGLAIIIPPSTLFILYGIAAEVSVAKLFMAGVTPGFMMAAGYFIRVLIARKTAGPALVTQPAPVSARLLGLLGLWPIGLLAFAIMGSMYLGVTTPTEAAAVGVFGAVLISLMYHRFQFKTFYQSLVDTVRTTGFLFMIVLGAFVFGFLMSYMRIPALLMEAALGSALSPVAFLIAVNIVFLFLGCVMDGAAIVLVVVPIILPMLTSLGFDPVWLGVILCINIEMGLTTPPVGMNLFVLQGATKSMGVSYWDIVVGATPFLISPTATIILVAFFPQLALWLPSQMNL